jgi:hypothetical protein
MQVISGEEGGEQPGGKEEGAATTEEDKASNPFLPKPPKGARPPPGPM